MKVVGEEAGNKEMRLRGCQVRQQALRKDNTYRIRVDANNMPLRGLERNLVSNFLADNTLLLLLGRQ